MSEWLFATIARATKGWLKFLLVWVPLSLLFAAWRVSTGASEGIPLTALFWVVPLVAIATFSGAFVYAATAPLRHQRELYYLAWAVSGATSVLVVLVLLWAVALAAGQDISMLSAPWLWAAATLAGALSGTGFGREARRWSSVEANTVD